MGVRVIVGKADDAGTGKHAGVLLQYPNTFGVIKSYGTAPYVSLS
jgi:hypothetical protein